MNKKRLVAITTFFLGLSLWGWFRLQPDRFFSDLSMDVSTKFIVSHYSPATLLGHREDQLVLRIPNSYVLEIKKILASQSRFRDVSKKLPHHYDAFRIGQENFFPSPCPTRFQAGRFSAWNREKLRSDFRFVLDQDKPDFAYLYISSSSGTNICFYDSRPNRCRDAPSG